MEKKVIYTSPKNYNSEIGLIFSIFQIEDYTPSIKDLIGITFQIAKKSLLEKKSYDILVAEYGIDRSGDMDFLLSIMKPHIGILTKLDSVHADNFLRWKQELWEDKWKLLLASSREVFLNAEDGFSLQQTKLLSVPYTLMFEGKIKMSLDHKGESIIQSFDYKKKKISINLIGNENIEYSVLALQIAEKIGIKLEGDTYSFNFRLQAGRFSVFSKEQHILIDSSYNAGPQSMRKILQNTQIIREEIYKKHKLIYILGDMREIGDRIQEEHISLAEQLLGAHAVFTVGPYMYQYMLPELRLRGFTGGIYSSLSSRAVGTKLKKYLKDNEKEKFIILFKGSQNTIFTEEALALQLAPSQRKNLPRQSEDWKKKKEEFFKSL